MTNWNKRYIELAKHISSWSKDPTKIGAVIVTPKTGTIISTGYNGFPRGVEDREERISDRKTKYEFTLHAEMNSLMNASRNGISTEDANLYVYGLPACHECAKGIVQAGIKKVYFRTEQEDNPRWEESAELARQIFHEGGVDVYKI